MKLQLIEGLLILSLSYHLYILVDTHAALIVNPWTPDVVSLMSIYIYGYVIFIRYFWVFCFGVDPVPDRLC